MEGGGTRRPGSPMARKEGTASSDASRELLNVGSGEGIHDMLLINSKRASKKVASLETARLPRSDVLDRVQSFLPQMALANKELRQEMATGPAHQFDIENLDDCPENIIEMNVALVELSGSDTDEEEVISEDSSDSEEDNCATAEVTIDTIKLPKQKGEKGKIEILDGKGTD
ncbi:NOP protein chaperone 1 [Carettochelys insculpta]|uniref:NOP protein chaperone 1 n=1 Tax=Carettochelys insculpta TaxID=44489 RepID=UPI003EB6DD5C